MTVVPILRRFPLTGAWMVLTIAFGTSAFGQELRFIPIRTAPLGSPAGTVGDPVTPQFNVDLGCWELRLGAGGVEVDFDLQAFGWGNTDCVQPTGLCRVDPGDACTLPSDCSGCTEDAHCSAGTCTDNGATCLEADNTGSGDPCISNTDCTDGTCSGSGGPCRTAGDCPAGETCDGSELCRGRPAPCSLGAIQATSMSTGYSNGVGGDLHPKGWPASPSDGVYQSTNVCLDNNDPCRGPFDPTCGGRPGGFCIQNGDFVMPQCANALSAVATPTLDYAWASAVQNNCNLDDGEIKTLGGLILEVPVNAAGTYMIDFDPDSNNSFMTSGTGTPIPDVVFTPACITLACQSDTDCDDGFSCTTDRCDEGTSSCENIIAQDFCLIDGRCIANGQQDPAESCRLCDISQSQTVWSNRFAGAACGDPTDNDCDNPDSCNGSGACVENFEPVGTACGDPADTECDNPDTCDSAGACLANVEPNGSTCTDEGNDCTRDFCLGGFCTHRSWTSGTPCGDATKAPCNGTDTCDGAGNCLSNVLPDDAPCPNGNFCDGAELCLGGVCQSAAPPCDPEDDLCNEQDDQCDLLGDRDGDLLVTQSDFLHWQDCETGPVDGPYAVGCEIFDFEQNGFVDLRDHARFQIAFTMP